MVLTSGAVICLSVHERQEAVLESLALQVEPIAGNVRRRLHRGWRSVMESRGCVGFARI